MTWTRSIRNLARHPLYLVMTLLPVLLICLLLFPLMQHFVRIFEQILQQQAYGAYYEYHEEWSAPQAVQFIGLFMPAMGMTLLISLIALLTELLLTPIAFQYLGDATSLGYVPAGYAGRGLRRLWWKPFVYSLLLSLCMNVALSPALILMMPMIAAAQLPVGGILSFFVVIALVIFISLMIAMVTTMFYASIAMEELPFFTAIGRAFSRTFSHFGRLLGAATVSGVLCLIPLMLVCVPTISSVIRAAEAFSGAVSVAQLSQFIERVCNQIAVLVLLAGILSWLQNCFLVSYSFQLTHECLMPPQPQPADARQEPPAP